MSRFRAVWLLRHVLKWTSYVAYVGILLVAALEILYRVQIVDFYRPELTSYNEALDSGDDRRTVLVFGDSFTAGQETYIASLREAVPGLRVVNSAIGGTGAVQAAIIARRRYATFEPEVVIYQVYVGNDLFDIRYSSNRRETGFARWAYWNISKRLRSIGWLNYRLAQIRSGTSPAGSASSDSDTASRVELGGMRPEPHDGFSPQLYTPRQRIMIAAEPDLFESTVLLRGARGEDYELFISRLRETLARCEPMECQAYVLVVPHKAQVSAEYQTHYRQLGATIDEPEALMRPHNPFVSELQNRLLDLEHVRVLDPLEEIQRREAEGVRLYYFNDEHMNQEGQAVLFETVQAGLESDGIL